MVRLRRRVQAKAVAAAKVDAVAASAARAWEEEPPWEAAAAAEVDRALR